MMPRTVHILAALIALSIGCTTEPEPVSWKAIETPEEFHREIEASHVVLFFQADWSMDATRTRKLLWKFIENNRHRTDMAQIRIIEIDFTKQWDSPLLKTLEEWAEAPERRRAFDRELDMREIAAGGYGTTVWVRSGRVVDIQIGTESVSVEDFRQQAATIFHAEQN